MMLDGPMKDAMAMGWLQSVPVPPELEFSKLSAFTRTPLIFALVLALGLWVTTRTTFGYEMRAVGQRTGRALRRSR